MATNYVRGVPQPLIWGSRKPPRIALALTPAGTQHHRCMNNHNLFLREKHIHEGTFEAGAFLEEMCRAHCMPGRSPSEPCPAFVSTHMRGRADLDLASVTARPGPSFEACLGVQQMIDECQSQSEVEFLLVYLDLMATSTKFERERIIGSWNETWSTATPSRRGYASRRAAFDGLMWGTLAFPALIPQVILNVLPADAPDKKNIPHRIDFGAYVDRQLVAIEVDGPSHFANVTATEQGVAYRADGSVYATTLKRGRYLEGKGWLLRQIGNEEVAELLVQAKLVPWKALGELHAVTRFDRREMDPGPTNDILSEEVLALDDLIPF